MSLFQCSKCGCCENTNCTNAGREFLVNWLLKDAPEAAESYRKILGLKPGEKFGAYCSACTPIWFVKECTCQSPPHHSGCKCGDLGIGPNPNPQPREGLWHGKFPRVFYPKGKCFTDRHGNLEGVGMKFPSETEYAS